MLLKIYLNFSQTTFFVWSASKYVFFDILLKTTYQNINTGNVGKVVVF